MLCSVVGRIPVNFGKRMKIKSLQYTSYHKLVRDRIPEIIEADGKICIFETLSDSDYIDLLDQKLNEELAEYRQNCQAGRV